MLSATQYLYRVYAQFTVCVGVLLASPAVAGSDSAPAPQPPKVVAVKGIVLATQSRWIDKSQIIVTDVTLTIEKSSDRTLTGTVTFTVPGGELIERNLRMTVNSAPTYRLGQEVAVSLERPNPELPNNPNGQYFRYRTDLQL